MLSGFWVCLWNAVRNVDACSEPRAKHGGPSDEVATRQALHRRPRLADDAAEVEHPVRGGHVGAGADGETVRVEAVVQGRAEVPVVQVVRPANTRSRSCAVLAKAAEVPRFTRFHASPLPSGAANIYLLAGYLVRRHDLDPARLAIQPMIWS